MSNIFKNLKETMETNTASPDLSTESSIPKRSLEDIIEDNEDYLNDGSNAYCGYSKLRKAEKKVKNAIKSYGDEDDYPSDVIFLLDDTLLGSGKDGFYLTNNKIYLKEAYEDPISFYISDIKSISFRDKDLRINNENIELTHSEHKRYVKHFVSCVNEFLEQ